MKRFFVISFLTAYILMATECDQLLRMPVLMQHFTEHKAQNQSISFFDFLHMHYVGTDFNDHDQDRDAQLPFKSTEDFDFEDLQSVPLKQETASLNGLPVIKESAVLYTQINFHSSYLSSVWQPPKLG